ncbi:MAG: TetR/AcrR family transcriptional regulator [Bacteroidales bacterium]|nr:TetR/AcrR family transcriptional regulator [Bacteroidales bacterium]
MTEKLSKDIRISSIIVAAVEEFLEKGYENSSMDAIAKKAGISKGGLYHHFRNKDEILSNANKVFTAPIMQMFEELGSNNMVIPALKKYIGDYIQYWDQHRKELRFFFLSMNKGFSDPSLLGDYTDYFRQELAFIEEIYAKGMINGDLTSLNARQLALSLISAMDGALAYLLIDDQLNPDELILSFQQQFVEHYKSATYAE